MRNALFLLAFLLFAPVCTGYGGAQDFSGYELWLKFDPVRDQARARQYRETFAGVYLQEGSATRQVILQELTQGLSGLLDRPVGQVADPGEGNILIVALQKDMPEFIPDRYRKGSIPAEGFRIGHFTSGERQVTLLTAPDESGLLYGAYRLLRLLQSEVPVQELDLLDFPRSDLRMLNHWDNLDRTVERGYAGFSIWNWHTLPDYIDPRYTDYARANASIGINATALTNVNANAQVLTRPYLLKVQALAEVFRPYKIRTYLTARFSAPIEIGGLETADPLDPEVAAWWKAKAAEIYDLIPDFGGFLVKANSEGQPGPQNYGRSHLQGANMMADALAPFGGQVIWRAFVYSEVDPTDRAKQAYDEFVPYDGKFRENVLLQVKNGPIDFQPREPFHPLFGAMPQTPMMIEFQITKEYLGFATHLAYLPRLFEEVLQADTYRPGEGATVARVITGDLPGTRKGGFSGVSNIGTDLNWTGHPFGQADWYGFGRLAWDPELGSGAIAEEWIRATLGNDPGVVATLKKMMLESREAVVSYMMPLGLHHLFDTGHHYGPGPWVDNLSRPEWNPVYYHQADTEGIGFDRSAEGSNAAGQYAPELAARFGRPGTCPEEYLLWFHHLPWDYRLKNGQSLWDGLGLKYQEGVDTVKRMAVAWEGLRDKLPEGIYEDVAMRLAIQLKEARWWKDACMQYFRTFSKMDFPSGMEPPRHSLEYYQSLRFPFAPGIRPSWD